MPVYLYWGEEDFSLKNAVLDLRKKLINPEWALLSHKRLDDPDITNLIETLQTLPMVMGNLFIEVTATSYFLRGNKKHSSSDSQMKKLIALLENSSPHLHVIFICPIPLETGKKIDSVLKLTKTIEKIGTIKEFPAFKSYQEKEIASWITQRATTYEIKIAQDAALALVHNTGNELRKLDSEISKLATAVHPQKIITKTDVLQSCATHENVFQLADYWLSGDIARALSELSRLLEKDHPVRIVATLQTMLRRWVKIKSESKTKNSFEVSKMLNIHKFVIEKDLQKLKDIPIEKLVKMKNNLKNTESKMKMGEMPAEMLLEMTICS